MTELAFLGTGVMGLPMARNLSQQGFVVHAWNRTPDKAAPLARDGVQIEQDPARAAAGTPIMVTMLADAEAVLDTAGRALGATDGPETWVQMSTIGLEGTERCRALADERDVTFVDAPVLGTRAPAEQGALVVLASGPESARPVADPVFAAVGSRTLWLGEAGAGSRAKVAINSWVLGVVGVLAETLSLAEGLGVDPQTFFDATEGGALDLPYSRLKGPAMMQRDFSDVSFSLSLARKDAQLALAAAAEAGLTLPMMEGALSRLRRAEQDGHGDEDMAATFWASAPDAKGTA
jgi:3-hydroxyisobutyrate dehydrogenase